MMYCNNCGAKLTEGARFCNECGAPVVPAVSAAPKEDHAAGCNPPAASPAQPAASPAQPSAPQPTPGPVYGAAQPAGYAPAQAQPGYVPPQPQPGYVPPQPGYPYAAQTPLPAAAPKKRHTGVIVLAVLLGLVLLVGALIFVFIRLHYEEPPLPAQTEPVATEAPSSDVSDPAATEAEKPAETTAEEEKPSVGENIPTDRNDLVLSAAQTTQTLDKLLGCWNTDDGTQFIFIKKMEGGLYYLTAGYWYSEADLMGYLRTPVKGDPDGRIMMTLYYEGYESETYSFPSLDDPISFDLSRIADGRLVWSFGGESQDVAYAGATMEEAIPPLQ